jgi:hypothetical protein
MRRWHRLSRERRAGSEGAQLLEEDHRAEEHRHGGVHEEVHQAEDNVRRRSS